MGGETAKTILCVEDEGRLRQDIIDELLIAGYNALGAANGREALTLLDARRPDLILCDISMPRLDGFGFLETMRDTRPDLADVPLVFLTALGGRDHIINGKRAGADDYLVKPIDFDLMLATIEARLGQIERIGRKAEEDVATLRDALSASPSGKSAGMERILDMLSFGVVLVSRSHVVFANRTARDIHEADGGLVIGKTVFAPSSRLSGELATIIDAACLAASQGQDHLASLCVPSSGEHDLLLTVCALPHAHDRDAGTPQAVIFISDPSRRPKVSGTILSELFGLTPTEADVACAIAHGRRTNQIAADLSISPTTVAFHLGNVFEKTRTHRQGDLIALILTALASIATPDAGKVRVRQ
jgi:DNA-binding NarL/FixJ family response regulator